MAFSSPLIFNGASRMHRVLRPSLVGTEPSLFCESSPGLEVKDHHFSSLQDHFFYLRKVSEAVRLDVVLHISPLDPGSLFTIKKQGRTRYGNGLLSGKTAHPVPDSEYQQPDAETKVGRGRRQTSSSPYIDVYKCRDAHTAIYTRPTCTRVQINVPRNTRESRCIMHVCTLKSLHLRMNLSGRQRYPENMRIDEVFSMRTREASGKTGKQGSGKAEKQQRSVILTFCPYLGYGGRAAQENATTTRRPRCCKSVGFSHAPAAFFRVGIEVLQTRRIQRDEDGQRFFRTLATSSSLCHFAL